MFRVSISLLIAPFIFLYLSYRCFIYPLFISPLAKVPNAHWSSPISPLWILLKRYGHRENRTIHAAHLKHGNLIRLGPNELSVACIDNGIKTVYGDGFEKWNWYPNLFAHYGKPHSVRKRMISHVYSKSFLQSSPDLHNISRLITFDRLLPLLNKAAVDEQPLDVLEINYSSAMDSITAFIFGLQNGTNFLEDATARKHWFGIYQFRRCYRFWNAELPGPVSFLKQLGIPIIPRVVGAVNAEFEDWTLSKCEAAERSIANSSPQPSCYETHPVVYSHLSTALRAPKSQTEPKPSPPDPTIASELLDQLAAGHETSGIALTYLMHELSKHPYIQGQLRSEVSTLSPSLFRDSLGTLSQEQHSDENKGNHLLPSPRSIDALPFLHAVVMETLRLHAPIPGPQPRITPPSPTTLVDSPPLPPGIRVSAQAYTLHRNPRVFPSPLSWNPSRWLDASEAHKAEMSRWFWAFGSGGRMCVGSNFAMQEIKLTVAAVYSNFRTRIVDDGGIEQLDAYTAGPSGKRLVLAFERV
ncbi:MAG: hypothetical protein LQ352_003578 [Teloschistes flavicans]|nr:MAG: hypothetical protein LQ352_003578 [Teloschistes flavicans]